MAYKLEKSVNRNCPRGDQKLENYNMLSTLDSKSQVI